MAITVAQAVAKIDADDSGLKSRFEGIKGKVHEAGGWFQTFGSTIAGVFSATAIIGGVSALVHGLGDMVQQGMDANAVAAQTAAVLQSTHGVAGMTAQAIGDLASQYMNLTGIDDDTIQSTENLLLTFTNIGQDIFPQTTMAALDMATALHEDTASAAMQLGKALQDPVNGVSALQRVGVKLTEQQKQQVDAMMAVGNTAGAQKIILGELNREFGHSAEKAGEANGGIKILTAQFNSMKQDIGKAIIPILINLFDVVQPLIKQFAAWLPGALDKTQAFIKSNVMPIVQRLGQWFMNEGLPALKRFGDFIMSTVVPVLGQLVQWFQANVLPALQRFAGFVLNNVVPVVIQLVGWFQAHVVPILQTLWSVFVNNILPALQQVWNSIATNLIPALQHLWEKLSPVLIPVLQTLGSILQNVVGPALSVAIGFVSSLIDFIATLIGKIGDLLGWLGNVKDAIGNAFGGVGNLLGNLPHFAAGGVMPTGGMAMVGEHGPELVYLPAGAHVMSAGETAGLNGTGAGSSGALLNSTGGKAISLTIPIHIAGRHVADAILPDLVKTIRNGTGLMI